MTDDNEFVSESREFDDEKDARINQPTAFKQLYHSSWIGTLKTTTFIIRRSDTMEANVIESEICNYNLCCLQSVIFNLYI